LAANGQAGKFLEPFSLRHFRLGAEPIRQKPKLIGGNFPAADAVEQMIKQAGRKIVPANSRHGYLP
jgi:DeoR/GlpR family transcriptional regulator of sugar metabolism